MSELPEWIMKSNRPPEGTPPNLLDLVFNYRFDDGRLTELIEVISLESWSLRTLGLRNTKVSDAGLIELAKAAQHGHLEQLQTLELRHTRVSDAGLIELAKAAQHGHLEQLQSLGLIGTQTKQPDELLDSWNAKELLAVLVSQLSEATNAAGTGTFKLLLVGQGEVGKTHLLRNLEFLASGRAPDYHNETENRTH